MEIDVKRLRQLSLEAQRKEIRENKKRQLLTENGEKEKEQKIAKSIIEDLPSILEEAAEKGFNKLQVCHMKVSGTRNDAGWLVDLEECQVGITPTRYLKGYLKTVYDFCQKQKLKVKLNHCHWESGEKTMNCFLVLIVSW